jgi:hypothetical protein
MKLHKTKENVECLANEGSTILLLERYLDGNVSCAISLHRAIVQILTLVPSI